MISEEKIARKEKFRERNSRRDVTQIKTQGVCRKGQASRSTDQRVEKLGVFYTYDLGEAILMCKAVRGWP